MSEQAGLEDLRIKVAVVEERMETMNERYDNGWALLREDNAKRDTTNTRWLIGIITAATAIIIGVVLSTA